MTRFERFLMKVYGMFLFEYEALDELQRKAIDAHWRDYKEDGFTELEEEKENKND